jgi:hypothetical protein
MQARGETLIKLTVPTRDGDITFHEPIFREYLKDHRLINTRSVRDGDRLEMTFLVKPRKASELMALSKALSAHPSIEKAAVVICDDEGLGSERVLASPRAGRITLPSPVPPGRDSSWGVRTVSDDPQPCQFGASDVFFMIPRDTWCHRQ